MKLTIERCNKARINYFSALASAAYYRERARERPAGWYRLELYAEHKKALEIAKILRINAL